MTPARWQEISQLFKAALEHEPARRRAMLASRCNGDDGLCREVEDLLASYEAAENSRFEPFAQLPDLLPEEDEPSQLGQRLGHYEITHEIGRGGMGTVYAAHRADDEYKKRVAIKLVKRGLDTREVLKRFRYERQILASLDHPNIARLLDGGTTDDGLPYFVMEYVEGEPLTHYCESHNLSLIERLALFREVCSAVTYAHQNLIVHRDLKPDNILVGADGAPKLLDFGIAKLLKPDFFPDTVIPTGLAVRPMTPDYASPEQVRGLPITTASDVYSLGVVLYELLTGHKPYTLTTYTPQEIERVICEEAPRRPSLAITDPIAASGDKDSKPPAGGRPTLQKPQITQRSLWGDVDNILLMALRKEPNRRYASAEQFSEDVRRYLAGLPVVAHQDTFAYRGRKFITRHKIGVLATAALAVLIISFAVFARIQTARAERQRVRAEAVSSFLVNIFKVANPEEAKGGTITAREILDKGAVRLERELSDQPETKATLMHTIGEVYDSLGLFEEAKQILERALAQKRQSFGANSEEVALTLEQLGWARFRLADYAPAEANYQEALAIWRNLYGNKHQRVISLLSKLGNSAKDRNDYESSVRYYREELEIARQLNGEAHPSVEGAMMELALALQKKDDFPEAEKYYREVVELTRRNNRDNYGAIANRLHNLGNFLATTKGDFDEAERLHREVLETERKLHGNEDLSVGFSLWMLASVLEAKKDYAGAEEALRKSREIYEKIFGQEHPRAVWTQRDLGRFLTYQQKFDEAEKLLREAAALQIKAQGEAHPIQALPTRLFLASLLAEKGDRAAAEKLLLEILPDVRQKYVAPNDIQGLAFLEYGKVLLARGEAAPAEPFLRAAWENLKKTGSVFKWPSAEAASALGECLTALRRYEEAEPLLTESYAQLKERVGPQRQFLIERARQRLIKLYQAWGRPKPGEL